ncbi:helix-turn-helix domain-containing protein [Cupriavidus gilardii]|uniref:Helix-turn-helix domain-containing protein n=1 Tax=Cupriavidus gilardii TaxID=82541 RepID=A0ABY4VPC4_9BURK|nr:helix-turn-helix transcriptional regulator [Cupriavidus gilardii]USE77213.1 helix-turn-helix domain-containing protein [Cupriavidus gilardii]UXC39301.1 helix-turn-helix domain-containing protein [Cupriavidus gilardii]
MSNFTVRTAEQLPQLLQAFRKEAGLTQAEAALRMGVSQQTLSALERNPARVSVDKLMRVLSVLGVELVLHKPAPQPHNGASSSPQVW